MPKKTITVILAVLSVLYILGLVFLFVNFGLGLVFWGAALLASLIFYFWQQHQKQLALEAELEAAQAAEKAAKARETEE